MKDMNPHHSTLDSNWLTVRQMVAERVLNRHHDDLEQQELAGEIARRRHSQAAAELDLLNARRHRATSLRVDATEPRIGTARRRSLPACTNRPLSPPAHASRSPRKADPQASPTRRRRSRGLLDEHSEAAPESPPRERIRRKSVVMNADEESGSDFLQLMRTTLEQAKEVEEKRPTLYLQPTLTTARLMAKRDPENSSKVQAGEQRKLTISIDNPPIPPRKDSIPSLIKGEAFIETGKSQVLCLEDDAPSAEAETSGSGQAGNAVTEPSTSNGTLTGHDRKSDCQGNTAAVDSSGELGSRTRARKTKPQKELEGNATVEFYDEDIGFNPSKDEGGFTPRNLSLNLADLKDSYSDDGDINDSGDDKKDEGSGTAAPNDGDVWSEAKKCRYIRGYDPPEMLMPAEPLSFVFNGKYTHSE